MAPPNSTNDNNNNGASKKVTVAKKKSNPSKVVPPARKKNTNPISLVLTDGKLANQISSFMMDGSVAKLMTGVPAKQQSGTKTDATSQSLGAAMERSLDLNANKAEEEDSKPPATRK